MVRRLARICLGTSLSASVEIAIVKRQGTSTRCFDVIGHWLN
jgi:hypothetical protein